jgi:hypothetical protein
METPLQSWRERTWLLGLLALCTAILLPILTFPLGYDQAVFQHAGKVLLSGGSFYGDFVDMNGPGAAYLHALGQLVFGCSDFRFRCLDLVWMLATYVVFYVLARCRLEPLWAGLILPVHAGVYVYLGWWQTSQRDSFALIGFFGLALCLHRGLTSQRIDWKTWFVGGVATGFLLCLRPSTLVLIPLLVAAILWSKMWSQTPLLRHRIVATLFFILGTSLIPLGIGGHLFLKSSLGAGMEEMRFLGSAYYNLGSAKALFKNLKGELWPLQDELRQTYPLFLFCSVAGGASMLLDTKRANRIWGLILATWSCYFLGESARHGWGGLFNYDKHILWGGMLLSAACGVQTLTEGLQSLLAPQRKWLAVGSCAVALLITLHPRFNVEQTVMAAKVLRHGREGLAQHYLTYHQYNPHYTTAYDYCGYSVSESLELTGRIDQLTKPGDSIQVVAHDSQVYLRSNRPCATRHANSYSLFARTNHKTGPILARWREEFMRDLEEHPPKVIAIQREEMFTGKAPAFPFYEWGSGELKFAEFFDWVHEHYEPQKPTSTYSLYLLKEPGMNQSLTASARP